MRYRSRSCTSVGHHLSPERLAIKCKISKEDILDRNLIDLLAKERNYSCWLSISQSTSCCSGTPMMNDRCDVLKEPFVGTVPYPVYVFLVRANQIRPAFRDDSTSASGLD